jgi:mRNA interferase MazF
MKRGDICWYTFKEPDKRRPVLIMTRDSAIAVLNSVTIAPITTTIRGIPTELVLSNDDGLPTESAVSCDKLQTVPKANISTRIAHLSATKMRAASAAVAFALALGE